MMAPRYLSTCSHKRGRPKTAPIPLVPHQRRQPAELIEQLYQRNEISSEHRLAAIYYRVLYYHVHSSMGAPKLARASITSLSLRFKPYRPFFSSEEQAEWHQEKEQIWKTVREAMAQEHGICLHLIDDVIIYKGADAFHCYKGLTPRQLDMIERALTHMASFFGLD